MYWNMGVYGVFQKPATPPQKNAPALASTDPFFGDQHEQPRAALHTSAGTQILAAKLLKPISFQEPFWLRMFL